MDLRTIIKRQWITGLAVIPFLAFVIASCDNTDRHIGPHQDLTPPPVPTGVTTVTMDQKVLVEWNAVTMNREDDDLAGYKIYHSLDNQHFTLIGTVGPNVTSFFDEGLTNGVTYYYAVSSFDFSGNISDLSTDNAFDTPRPEGSVTLFSANDPDPYFQDRSGFDFSSETRTRWDDPATNFYLVYDASPNVQSFFIYVPLDGSRIQDMGYTQNFDEITYAPESGWSSQGICEVITGHTYVIKTRDNHYAKVRAFEYSTSPTYNYVLDWGYQIDPGNRELKIAPVGSGKYSSPVNGGSF